jgi:hypothetical protein
MSSVAPIPAEWCDAVIKILKRGAPAECRWSLRARQDWQLFGMLPDAYSLLIKVLSAREVWGEQIFGMEPLPKAPRGEEQTIYAFLCPHPFSDEIHLYAKIGLFDGHVHLDVFSLHNDNTDKLRRQISAAKKKQKAAQKKKNKR